ncbi:tartrate dehydrogenase/decarboxylase/D-malate dehydrogenase [Melghirimyces profundicolus]|uniref:D-malate dehydrogenase (decarboxylating) n=1 Tax=Melghirimyces profundicolus TaxID=1242148 RepID=A0A2T6C8I8_9BACL|nr:tartrate dehydrogenase [Melghirimyces profundicolus]PTX64613.1 tartrate dehydrogenase/decarboxylase/D-malate dehydrogenase [Melghirimyces profundicolus]
MKEYRLAVLPGDGVGPEVMMEGLRVLHAVEELHGGLRFRRQAFDWNCDHYRKHGRMMPEDGLSVLRDFDAIQLGAIGAPDVPDPVSIWELILPIRRGFDQYINYRPIKLLRGIESPLRDRGPEELDFVVIRENTEGEYSDSGGRLHRGTSHELAVQNSVFTRHGTERVIRYAFEWARTTGKTHVTAATKSNGINHTMPFWDEIFREVAQEHPGIETWKVHMDALAACFVTRPQVFEVVVASNLFGDILTDLGAAIVGGLGLAPSGNLNPDGRYPSMFEPIHGSAPDIAGKGIANPIAQIWSVSLMLEHLGHREEAGLILEAVEEVLVEGTVRTPDLGGSASTREMGEAIRRQILKRGSKEEST